ncbi:hypothetical protein K439DRAFT_1137339 [Ramaria rubella]|nr:hypothetical protein K439DRAFT_1137339 [Ramaria rubella]
MLNRSSLSSITGIAHPIYIAFLNHVALIALRIFYKFVSPRPFSLDGWIDSFPFSLELDSCASGTLLPGATYASSIGSFEKGLHRRHRMSRLLCCLWEALLISDIVEASSY